MVTDIITALGTVATTASVASGFAIYRLQKRDEYLSEVRGALQRLSCNMEELDSLLNYEFAYELASALVFAEATQYSLERVFQICNECILGNIKKEIAKKRVREALGVFGVSFQDQIVNRYTNLMAEIRQVSVIFYPDYKGLYRFSKACAQMMSNVFQNNKRMLLDEDVLSGLIVDEMILKDPWDSYEHFQKELLDNLVSLVESGRRKHFQKNINCLRELVDIIVSGHIELTAKEWRNLANSNRKISLKPYNSTETITADLREAEKCFRSVMDHDTSMRYASLVQTIEDSNKSPK